jgi:hypothetical protein
MSHQENSSGCASILTSASRGVGAVGADLTMLQTSFTTARKSFEESLQKMQFKFNKCVEDVNIKEAYLISCQAKFDDGSSNATKRVRLNIGGQYLDIQRSTLQERNFLTALFQPRWEKYLLKDKNGRIYLDYDFDWIEPLIKAIINQGVVRQDHSVIMYQLIKEFELEAVLRKRAKFPFLEFNDSKKILMMEEFLSLYGSPEKYSLSKFYSYPNENAENELFSKLTEKKDVLFVIETRDKGMFCCLTDQDCLTKNPVCGGKTRFINLSNGVTKNLPKDQYCDVVSYRPTYSYGSGSQLQQKRKSASYYTGGQLPLAFSYSSNYPPTKNLCTADIFIISSLSDQTYSYVRNPSSFWVRSFSCYEIRSTCKGEESTEDMNCKNASPTIQFNPTVTPSTLSFHRETVKSIDCIDTFNSLQKKVEEMNFVDGWRE